jgi:hypothetical protein
MEVANECRTCMHREIYICKLVISCLDQEMFELAQNRYVNIFVLYRTGSCAAYTIYMEVRHVTSVNSTAVWIRELDELSMGFINRS